MLQIIVSYIFYYNNIRLELGKLLLEREYREERNFGIPKI